MKQLNPSQFLSTLLQKVSNSVALILHQSADPDAIGSAAALAKLLMVHGKNKPKIFAESLNRSAKNIAQAFDITIAEAKDLPQHDVVVLVDLNNAEQMGDVAPHLRPKNLVTFCIDHHVPHKSLPKFVNFLLYDDSVRSTAELVLQLWEASEHSLPSDEATL
ncbi:MAG: bifunctional oligoribonuclease/PAP phosphatase NrnA, partial [Promethearchaeota archaeon]